MIPRIFHQVHLGEPMPREMRTWVKSVGEHHPEWSHIIWDEVMLDEFGYDIGKLKDRLGSYASITNFLRLQILMRIGGVYLDTDVEARDSLERLPLGGYINFAAEQDGGRICNAIMGAQRGSKWISWQIENFDKFDQRDAAGGVYLATSAPREELMIVPQRYFYPWLYDSPPEKRVPHCDSILVHHWAGSWTK